MTTLEGVTLADRYRLGERLGHGGMADVYDGHDVRLGRPVAVKVLRPEMAAQPEVRTRFENEARAAAGLGHPNVVSVYDTGEADGVPYIVMERLPGVTLGDRMADGPMEESFVRRVAGDVLGALGVAHAAGLIHRDVKPANILLGSDGCAKVADFGIAKSMEAVEAGDPTASSTGTNLLLGTPAYLAPERIQGAPASPQSDLFSLGVVLHEAVTGQRAFPGATPIAVADAVLHGDIAPVLSLRPDLDPALATAIDRAVRRDPAHRFASAEEMAAALGVTPAPSVSAAWSTSPDATTVIPVAGTAAAEPLMAGAAAGPIGAVPVAWRNWLNGFDWRQRRGAMLAAAGVILLVLIATAAALGGDGEGQQPVSEQTTSTAVTTTTPTTAAPAAVPEDEDEDEDKKGEDKGRGKGDEKDDD